MLQSEQVARLTYGLPHKYQQPSNCTCLHGLQLKQDRLGSTVQRSQMKSGLILPQDTNKNFIIQLKNNVQSRTYERRGPLLFEQRLPKQFAI